MGQGVVGPGGVMMLTVRSRRCTGVFVDSAAALSVASIMRVTGMSGSFAKCVGCVGLASL